MRAKDFGGKGVSDTDILLSGDNSIAVRLRASLDEKTKLTPLLPLFASSPTNFEQPDHLFFQPLLTIWPTILSELRLYIAVTTVKKNMLRELVKH